MGRVIQLGDWQIFNRQGSSLIMTACAYVSPPVSLDTDQGVVPAIISDTLVTYKSFGAQVLHPVRTPGNIHFDEIAKADGWLTRKIQIVDDHLAFACAGDGNKIRAFSNDVRYELDRISESDRPMRLLGDHANRWNIEMVGAYAKGTPASPGGYNFVVPHPSSPLRVLGDGFGVAGSGGAALESLIRSVDAMIADQPFESPMSRLVYLLNYCNSFKFMQEYYNPKYSSWGGYLEMCYHDPIEGAWRMGPSTLNVFLFYQKRESKRVDLVGDRYVSYKPDREKSTLISIGPAGAELFVLNGLLSSPRGDYTAVDFVVDEFEVGSVTHYVMDGDRYEAHVRSLPIHHEAEIKLRLHDDGLLLELGSFNRNQIAQEFIYELINR